MVPATESQDLETLEDTIKDFFGPSISTLLMGRLLQELEGPFKHEALRLYESDPVRGTVKISRISGYGPIAYNHRLPRAHAIAWIGPRIDDRLERIERMFRLSEREAENKLQDARRVLSEINEYKMAFRGAE